MWDTAGQERYRSLTTFFINESDSIILGYDVTSPFSFESIKSFWYEHSKKNSETDLIYLVGNKIDLIDDRRVSKDEARQYCEENNIRYFEISCLTTTGIEDLFIDLKDQLIKR